MRLNFTMAHDDGHLPEDLNDADIVILGISRTSKTPTSIYLAQRGYKTANVPLVPSLPLPEQLTKPHTAFIVCLIASPERIAEIRRHRAMLLGDRNLDDYVDRDRISAEIVYSRRICAKNGWPVIDVTRRSVEESAATILKLLHNRDAKPRRAATMTATMAEAATVPQIVLASASRARREMLAAAGVAFTVEPADVDEPAIRRELAKKGEAGPLQVAEILARAKAEDVSASTMDR